LIAPEVFAAVAEQLEENRLRARQAQRGARHLLQGLVACEHCGYGNSGTLAHWNSKAYGYYRCIGSEAYRFGGERKCDHLPVDKDVLEELFWQRVREVLENPRQLEEEYRRRLQELTPAAGTRSHVNLEAQLSTLRQGVARFIDSDTEGFLEKSAFEPRLRRQRERISEVEEQLQHLADEAMLEQELRQTVGHV
jgi:site-specific DNA recombinase